MDGVDVLLERASRILKGDTLPVDEVDDEIAMDYLAEHEDFMSLLERTASANLERSFRGPGDSAFEEAMVNLMDAVQRHLRATQSSETSNVPRVQQQL